MAAVVFGGGRDTEEAAAVGRSANFARARESGCSARRAEQFDEARFRFDTRPLDQSVKALHESGAEYARFAQRGLPN